MLGIILSLTYIKLIYSSQRPYEVGTITFLIL